MQLMEKYDVNNIVFSSSATVYGMPKTVPITEDFPRSTTNPYGSTKLVIEDIMTDTTKAKPEAFGYAFEIFQSIGAHESGTMGEDPKGIRTIFCRMLRR